MAEPKLDTWRYRRRAVFASIAYCMASLAWLIAKGNDGVLHVTLGEGLLWLLGVVVVAYVFGPLAEDIIRARAGLPPRKAEKEPGA